MLRLRNQYEDKNGDIFFVPDDSKKLPRAFLSLEELEWIKLGGNADYTIINGNDALDADITEHSL